jgi:spore germination cell wall hydrolase CwlJ-like protein
MLAMMPRCPRPLRRLLTVVAVAAGAPLLLNGDDNTARAAHDLADVRAEIECLALNIYHEARGESRRGKIAVGHVVMNRVAADSFPDSVCGVVKQGGEERRYRCQFSWWCDGRSDEPDEQAAWQASREVAHLVYWALTPDPTSGAKWYHTRQVSPSWGEHFVRGPTIGAHVFYHPTQQVADASQDAPPDTVID